MIEQKKLKLVALKDYKKKKIFLLHGRKGLRSHNFGWEN